MLNTTGPALSDASPQAPGNVLNIAAQIRALGNKPWGPEVAGALAQALNGLQDQSNKFQMVLSQPLPSLKTITVTDMMGNLVGAIGDLVMNGIVYLGAWMKEFRIGGTSPASAKIVADVNGNVTIDASSFSIGGAPGANKTDPVISSITPTTITIGYAPGATPGTFLDHYDFIFYTATYTGGIRTS